MHALIQDGQIQQVSVLPRIWYDGTRWWDYRLGQNDPTEQGWLEVQSTPRPADTATTTHDWSVELVDGVPTVTWTARDKTPEELAAEAEQAARESDRAAIVEQALVWLAQDSAQAAQRIAQIGVAIADVDTQIQQVAGYTFAGGTVAQVNQSLNQALKPMLSSILARQKQVAQQLQELNEARDKHGDALAWLGRYVT